MVQAPKPSHRFFGSALFWGSAAVALLGCAVYIGWQAIQQGDIFTQQAFETARQVHISTATGEITGMPPAVPAPVAPAPPEVSVEPTAEKPAAETDAAPDAPSPSPEPSTPDESSPQELAPPTPEPAASETPDAVAPVPPVAGDEKEPPVKPEPATAPPDLTNTPVHVSSGSGLADAPAEGFTESTPYGLLPVVASDGTKPWQYYARPFVRTQDRPAIALVLTGVGLNKQASEMAAALPDNISLSLSPYSADIAAWAKSLRTRGHEILLDLPVEPVGYPAVDPGPDGLLTSLRPEQNVESLKRIMGKITGYIGMTIPPKERFTANKEAAYPVMQNINGRGLLFVLAVIPEKSVEDLFKYNSFPYLTSDRLIDQDLSPAAVAKQLSQLEDVARRQGYAIGTARALPATLQQISLWSTALTERNIELVPVSAIAKTKYK